MSPSRLLVSLAGLALLSGAATAQAGTVTGRWLNLQEKGVIELYEWGPKICGRARPMDSQRNGPDVKDVKNHDPALRDRSVNGLQIIQDFAGGPGVYTGGKIYRPTDGNTYAGKLELVDDQTLKLTGCVTSFLCQSQLWKRVP